MADPRHIPIPGRPARPAATHIPVSAPYPLPGSRRLRYLTIAAGPSVRRRPAATCLVPGWRRPTRSAAAPVPVTASTEDSAATAVD